MPCYIGMYSEPRLTIKLIERTCIACCVSVPEEKSSEREGLKIQSLWLHMVHNAD